MNDAPGLSCRACGCRDLRVYRTVPLPNGKIRRERRCRNCDQMLLTTEKPAGGEDIPDVAVLTDKQRENLWRQLMGWFL